MFGRYTRYTGCSIIHVIDGVHGPFEKGWIVRLYDDGRADLYAGERNHVFSTSHIPDNVWPSLNDFFATENLVEQINSILGDREAGVFVGFDYKRRAFPLLCEETNRQLDTLETPVNALSHSENKNPMSHIEQSSYGDK